MTDVATAPENTMIPARVSTAVSKMTGTQKVAMVLMQMNREQAAAVMKQFSEVETQDIVAEIVRLRTVEADVAEGAVREFYELTMSGHRGARGGRDFARGLLEESLGIEAAAGMMERLASSMAGKAFEFLDDVDAGQIQTLLGGEMPQTIALILAHLKPELASPVMAGLEPRLRTDVAQCIATMGSATPEAVGIVAATLRTRAGAVVDPQHAAAALGGIQPLVDIINRADIAMERAVLEGLELRDPELAEEVKARMLTFGDIVKFERKDVQLVLRGIDPGVLALAMKGASEAVVELIRSNVSERNREVLDDEIKNFGRVRISQVEEARAAVVRAIRDLEAEGVISLQRGDEDEYVS
ncbi:flagellar motor switch protein FliG [Arthrobacter roseus]|uniref:flagellar motor switch protein FliG n=1 Tax=Arthrobacter roseus TaxID=136274 RepID=UPI001EF92A07|nr:flagellar motor switch protein FliG [Arthrobacter roseus]MBM7847660.1 flagellar motor switch protein FliG [Arthrobacter roseus]